MMTGKAVRKSPLLVLLTLVAATFVFTGTVHAQSGDVQSIITGPISVGANSGPIPALGINVSAPSSPSFPAALTAIEVVIFDDSGGNLTVDDFANVKLYEDIGATGCDPGNENGIFNPPGHCSGGDQEVAVVPSSDATNFFLDATGIHVIFTLPAATEPTAVLIPADDAPGPYQGIDFFVTFTMSGTTADDAFHLCIPQIGITASYDGGGMAQEFSFPLDSVCTNSINVGNVQMSISQFVTDGQGTLPRSGHTEIFGLDASRITTTEYSLNSVTVRVEDYFNSEVGDESIYEVTPSDFMVFELYRDGFSEPLGRNAIFDPPGGTEYFPDILIGTVSSPFGNLPWDNTPFYVTIPVAPANPGDTLVPGNNEGSNNGADFFVVMRTSDTIDSDFDICSITNQLDDFTFTLEEMGVEFQNGGGSVFLPAVESCPPEGDCLETAKIVTEGLALDTWQYYPMDSSELDSLEPLYPGHFDDTEDTEGALRYHYVVPGESLRRRYLGERDTAFTGLTYDTFERFVGPFEQPVVAVMEHRQEVLALDIAGGTANNPEFLDGITLTLGNLPGVDIQSWRDFDPSFGLDGIIGQSGSNPDMTFSGIAVYKDSDNNGEFELGVDEPLEFFIESIPGLGGPYPYNANGVNAHYTLKIRFEDEQQLELVADRLHDYFVVIRPDSGNGDDSGFVGDGTPINYGADFKITFERAEDVDGDGVSDRGDLNSDGIPQPLPIRFQYADPYDGLAIIADNSAASSIKEARRLAAVIDGQDLAIFHGCDLIENDPTCSMPIEQRIDATSRPIGLLALNMATSDIPQLDLIEEPLTLTELRLNFSGEGFDPEDIADIFLVRDDKSPIDMEGECGSCFRSVGVFDVIHDLYNNPQPDFSGTSNPDEDSPVDLTEWEWESDVSGDYVVLTPKNPPRIYSDDNLDETPLDPSDNYEMIQSEINPGISIPRDNVFTGADYFIAIRTSESIGYNDEIRIDIPFEGLSFSNGITNFEGSVNLFHPEYRYSDVRSVRANVPVILEDLVDNEQQLDKNSDYTPLIGFNMYTNQPPVSQGGVDVYFEQLIVAFLQFGTHDTFNLASDLLPFENINEDFTDYSGIQLFRDANGNGVFDGPPTDSLVDMDSTPLLGPNPSRCGLAGDESNQVLMVFSSPGNRQLVPPTDTGDDEGNDFFLVIRTSSEFSSLEDNFSVAIIGWGPDSPMAPAPHTVNALGAPPHAALSNTQSFPWTSRGIGFVDSTGRRTRSNETINTNVFNATRTTFLYPVDMRGRFVANECDITVENNPPCVDDPTRQVYLFWWPENCIPGCCCDSDGYWLESDIYGDSGEFEPLFDNPLPAPSDLPENAAWPKDAEKYLFEGPGFLSGKTVQFRIRPFRDSIGGTPENPPYNGPGPTSTIPWTFWSSAINLPIAAFVASPTEGCAPLAVCFEDDSIGVPTSWTWSFGDGGGSIIPNPCHTYTAPGVYSACLTVSNDHGSTSFCRSITVRGSPVADFSADPVNNACVGESVDFTDTSTGIPTSWLWSFGDGGTSNRQYPSHVYTASNIYDVSLRVENACGSDTFTKAYTVIPDAPIVANFVSSSQIGYTPALITFADVSTGNPSEWLWSFGDGDMSTEQNPTHTYDDLGFYTVSMTAANGCAEDTVIKESHILICGSVELAEPVDGAIVTSSPIFSWTTDCDNIFVVEFSLEPDFSTIAYRTPVQLSRAYILPSALWNRVPRYTNIYWRVRSAVYQVRPLNVQTSPVRMIRKN